MKIKGDQSIGKEMVQKAGKQMFTKFAQHQSMKANNTWKIETERVEAHDFY